MRTVHSPASVHVPTFVDAGPRGFAGLTRDTVAVLVRAPVPLVVVPIVVQSALLVVAELATLFFDPLADPVAVTLAWALGYTALTIVALAATSSIVLATLRLLRDGDAIGLARVLAVAAAAGWRVLVTTWSASWRVGLGFALFIVPGLVLMSKYVVALPATVFDGAAGRAALARSADVQRGARLRVAAYGFLACALTAWTSTAPEAVAGTSTLVTLLLWAPGAVVPSALLVGATLVFFDLTDDGGARPLRAPRIGDAPPASGRSIVAALAVVAFLASLATMWVA